VAWRVLATRCSYPERAAVSAIAACCGADRCLGIFTRRHQDLVGARLAADGIRGEDAATQYSASSLDVAGQGAAIGRALLGGHGLGGTCRNPPEVESVKAIALSLDLYILNEAERVEELLRVGSVWSLLVIHVAVTTNERDRRPGHVKPRACATHRLICSTYSPRTQPRGLCGHRNSSASSATHRRHEQQPASNRRDRGRWSTARCAR
jgi:hypothetical protein